MKFLMLSIGDMHLSNTVSITADKIKRLSELVLSRCKDIDNLIIVGNGDIVSEGTEEQYLAAIDFFSKLEDDVSKGYPNLDISYVFSPGNHDCNISKSIESKKIKELKSDIKDKKSLEKYLEQVKSSNDQSSFFEFCDLLKNPYMKSQEALKDVFRFFDYNFENGKLRFVSVNSSLFFNKETTQGDIYLNSDDIKKNLFDVDKGKTIVISHYPIEWINRNNGEKIDEFFKSFNVSIVGHEHFGEITLSNNSIGEHINVKNPMFNSNYQEKDTGVVLITFDTEKSIFNFQVFIYNGNLYDLDEQKQLTHIFDEKAHNNDVSLFSDFYEKIHIVDEIITDNKDTDISSIYVDLPLKYVNEDKNENDDKDSDSKSEDYEFDYVSSNDITFETGSVYGFYGKMSSGKTTLLNRYYSYFFSCDKMPILIDAHSINKRLDEESLLQIIKDRFSKQYDASLETFMQRQENVIIIIDDFQEIQDYENKKFMIKYIKENFRFFIFTSSVAYQSTDLSELDFNEFHQFEILQLGQTEIYELCEKWMKLNGDIKSPNYHNKLVRVKSKINALVKRKYVPLNPFFILMILKANDENLTEDLVNSNKRVYYEYLISKLIIDMNDKIKMDESDIKLHLNELAYFIYKNDTPEYNDFLKYMENSYTFDDQYYFVMKEFKNELIRRRIIIVENRIIRFHYQFMFYTFLAQYITENIDDNPIDFDYILENILDEDNTNILLFLAQYFAKKVIVSKVISKANSLLEDFKEINYTNEYLEVYNHFISGVKDVAKFGNVKDNHKKMAKLIDVEQRNKEEKIKECNEENILSNLSVKQRQMIEASKMMQIINELLFARHQSSVTKSLIESGIALGRRIQSFYTYEFIESMNEIAESIKTGKISSNPEAETDFIKRMIYMFLDIELYCIKNLGNIRNLPVITSIEIDDEDYKRVLEFIFKFKSEDQDVKFNMDQIKELIRHFDKSDNKLMKGLVVSLLGYHLNYVGVSPRKVTELSRVLNISNSDRVKLLAKTTKE